MREIYREIVAAVIISKDEKIFLGMKNPAKGGVYSDCWHIPGGGIDDGESKEQALIREIMEETGIDIEKYEIKLIDSEGTGEAEKTLKDAGEKVLCKMRFNVYEIKINDQLASEIKISLDDDLEKFVWSDISGLKNMKLTPPSEELFKRLGYL
jgi:8-oxo-dGTP pyrophosphatase MutT (NUDIX family)